MDFPGWFVNYGTQVEVVGLEICGHMTYEANVEIANWCTARHEAKDIGELRELLVAYLA